MRKVLFSVFFIAIPIFSISGLTIYKMIFNVYDFFEAFESTLPTIFFYYLALSILWRVNVEK